MVQFSYSRLRSRQDVPADDLAGLAVVEEERLHLVRLHEPAVEWGPGRLAARLRAAARLPAGDEDRAVPAPSGRVEAVDRRRRGRVQEDSGFRRVGEMSKTGDRRWPAQAARFTVPRMTPDVVADLDVDCPPCSPSSKEPITLAEAGSDSGTSTMSSRLNGGPGQRFPYFPGFGLQRVPAHAVVDEHAVVPARQGRPYACASHSRGRPTRPLDVARGR